MSIGSNFTHSSGRCIFTMLIVLTVGVTFRTYPKAAAIEDQRRLFVQGQLEGVFVGYTSYQRVVGSFLRPFNSFNSIQMYFDTVAYAFWRDGRVYRGIPEGGQHTFDFGRMRSIDPEHCGRYRLAHSTIELFWDDRRTETLSFQRRSTTTIVIDGVTIDADTASWADKERPAVR